MKRLHPEESFTPEIERVLGKGNIIVVKSALGGQPIRRWYKDWKPLIGNEPIAQPDLYDSLMVKVNKAIKNEKLATITFVWMQGERDAREGFGEVYEESLIGLYNQINNELDQKDLNFVIGRLSDFGNENVEFPHWNMVRDAQVKVAESNPRFGWIKTDDLNDGYNRKGEEIKNDLHLSADGYVILGKRFADRSIELIEKNK